MGDLTLVDSSFSGTINALLEKVDILPGGFTLPAFIFQSHSPAPCSAGNANTRKPSSPSHHRPIKRCLQEALTLML